MNDEQFSKLMEKLEQINNNLLRSFVKDLEFNKQVEFLFQSGLKEIDIVKFLNSNRDKVHNVVRKLK